MGLGQSSQPPQNGMSNTSLRGFQYKITYACCPLQCWVCSRHSISASFLPCASSFPSPSRLEWGGSVWRSRVSTLHPLEATQTLPPQLLVVGKGAALELAPLISALLWCLPVTGSQEDGCLLPDPGLATPSPALRLAGMGPAQRTDGRPWCQFPIWPVSANCCNN